MADEMGGGMGGDMGEHSSFSDIGGESIEPGDQSGIEGQNEGPAGGTE